MLKWDLKCLVEAPLWAKTTLLMWIQIRIQIQ